MLCSKCAQPNADEARFCTSCGQPLTSVEPTVSHSVAPDPINFPTPWEQTVARDAQPADQTVYGTSPYSAAVPDNGMTQAMPAYNRPSPDMPAAQNQDVYYGAPPPNANPTGDGPAFAGQQPPQAHNNMPAQPGGYVPPMVQQPPTAYGAPYGYAQPQMNPCRVCGTMIPPQSYTCPRCGAPVGTIANPNDSTSTTYLPVGYANPYILINSSGQQGAVPPEIENMGWSWGAFGVNWIWCLSHEIIAWGIAMLFLTFFTCGILGLPIAIYFGICGNRLAWQNRRFDSIEHFQATQRVWAKWGIGLFVAALLLLALYILAVIARVSSASLR